MAKRVVVGVHTLSCSRQAVELVAKQSSARRVALHIVHVLDGPPLNEPVRAPMTARDRAEALRAAEGLLAETAAAAEAMTVRAVTTEVLTGSVAAALADVAADAAVLVVARRSGPVATLSSTARIGRIMAISPCPVLVAQGVAEPGVNVLVGIGTSPVTAVALDFAFREASQSSVGLTAIHAWRSPVFAIHGVAGRLSLAGEPASNLEAARILSEALAGWQERFPDVAVRRALPEGSTTDALVQASVNAQMLVVGSRRGGAVRSSVIVHEVIRRAMCPVAVTPQS